MRLADDLLRLLSRLLGTVPVSVGGASMIHYCKDCKWFKNKFIDRIMFGYRYGICNRPDVQEKERLAIVLVTGKYPDSDMPAKVERTDYEMLDHCGTQGKYWEEKNP